MVGPSLHIRKELEYPPPPPLGRPGPEGGEILFKHPYRSVLMGGFRGGNRKITSYMGFYRE